MHTYIYIYSTDTQTHALPALRFSMIMLCAGSNASVGFTLNLQVTPYSLTPHTHPRPHPYPSSRPKDPKLIALAKALAPANLRVGGSNADVAMYNEEFPGDLNPNANSRAIF